MTTNFLTGVHICPEKFKSENLYKPFGLKILVSVYTGKRKAMPREVFGK